MIIGGCTGANKNTTTHTTLEDIDVLGVNLRMPARHHVSISDDLPKV